MTQEDTPDQEPIEINRDVDCMIYAGRYGKMAGSPAAQFYVTLVLDAATQSRLAGLLGANLKGQVTVHFLNIQPPLPDDEEDEDEEKPSNQRAFTGYGSSGIEGIIVDGAAFLPHEFVASAANAEICSTCTTHRVTAIHIGQGVPADLTPEQRREQFAARPFEHSFYASDDDQTCMICGAEDPDDSAHVTEEAISAKAQLAARQRRS